MELDRGAADDSGPCPCLRPWSRRRARTGARPLRARMPWPWSITETDHLGWPRRRRARPRCAGCAAAGATSCIASIALRVRFSSTCSSIMRSAGTGGRRGRDVDLDGDEELAAPAVRPAGRSASISAGIVTGSRCGSRCLTKSCTLRMMWPARCACGAGLFQRRLQHALDRRWPASARASRFSAPVV